MAWILLFAVIAIGAAVPLWLESCRTKIGKAARAGVPGKFVRLSQGVTYYRWIGPVRGPVAVMIHGLSTPSAVFDDVAAGLGGLGYRVLVYDLYGRGLSDAPSGKQDRAFFLRQLSDLLADQKLGEDLTIVGYSMGGSIGAAFSSGNPHRMKRLIMLAPAGIITHESDFSAFCRKYPILGDWLHGVLAARRMRQEHVETPISETQLAELSRRGFLPAILASRRGMLSETQKDDHRAINRDGIPVVAIWGDNDTVIPISALGQLAQWNRSARQEVVKGAGHGLPYTHSKEVLTILRDVLREV